jgi:hypothetical protein
MRPLDELELLYVTIVSLEVTFAAYVVSFLFKLFLLQKFSDRSADFTLRRHNSDQTETDARSYGRVAMRLHMISSVPLRWIGLLIQMAGLISPSQLTAAVYTVVTAL